MRFFVNKHVQRDKSLNVRINTLRRVRFWNDSYNAYSICISKQDHCSRFDLTYQATANPNKKGEPKPSLLSFPFYRVISPTAGPRAGWLRCRSGNGYTDQCCRRIDQTHLFPKEPLHGRAPRLTTPKPPGGRQSR